MKLKELKKIIDKASKNAGKTNPEVAFLLNNTALSIKSVGQFNITPDIIFEFKKKRIPEKITENIRDLRENSSGSAYIKFR